MSYRENSPIDLAVKKAVIPYQNKILKLNSTITELRLKLRQQTIKPVKPELVSVLNSWDFDGLIKDFVRDYNNYLYLALRLYKRDHKRGGSFNHPVPLHEYDSAGLEIGDFDLMFSYTTLRLYFESKGFKLPKKVDLSHLNINSLHVYDNYYKGAYMPPIFAEKGYLSVVVPYVDRLVDFSHPILPRSPKNVQELLATMHPIHRYMTLKFSPLNFTDQEMYLLEGLKNSHNGEREPLIPFWLTED